MSKRLFTFCFFILFCFVMCACNSNSENRTLKNEKGDINWTDYSVSGVTNVTDACFVDENRARIESKEDKNKKDAIRVEPICPYCKCNDFLDSFEFEELPAEKLGNETILVEKTTSCSMWDEHADPFTADFNISILLTLEK